MYIRFIKFSIMNLRSCIPGIIGLLAFSSCEKAYTPGDINPPAPTGSSNGSLLVKNVTIANTDTTVTTYEYNTSKQLTKMNETFNSGGTTSNITYKLMRDNDGKVVQVVLGNPKSNTSVFTDSVVQSIHYPAGSLNFDYKLFSFRLGALNITDSTAFTYTNGRVTNIFDYRNKPGSVYTLAGKVEYTYDLSGNMSIAKIYSYSTITANDTLTVTLFYDDKKATLQLGNEAHLLGIGQLTAKNNIIKAVSVSADGKTTDTSTSTVIYQYNANNFPVSAVITQNPGGIISKATYYYQ